MTRLQASLNLKKMLVCRCLDNPAKSPLPSIYFPAVYNFFGYFKKNNKLPTWIVPTHFSKCGLRNNKPNYFIRMVRWKKKIIFNWFYILDIPRYLVCSVIGVIYIYLCLPSDDNNNKCLIVFQVYLDPQCIPTLVLVSFLLVFMDQTFHKCNGK